LGNVIVENENRLYDRHPICLLLWSQKIFQKRGRKRKTAAQQDLKQDGVIAYEVGLFFDGWVGWKWTGALREWGGGWERLCPFITLFVGAPPHVWTVESALSLSCDVGFGSVAARSGGEGGGGVGRNSTRMNTIHAGESRMPYAD
jgi:hypothetical protein